MIATEEEAKTKWCPHVRHTGGEADPPANATQSLPDERVANWNSCIGSACSQWRWVMSNYTKNGNYLGRDTQVSTDKGYCGLAGKP